MYQAAKEAMAAQLDGAQDLLVLESSARGRFGLRTKRAIDATGALFGLALTLPLLIITAILIRLDSPGPAIFRQRRVGRSGTTFKLYKFRSMYVDAPERFPELYRYSYTAEEAATLRFHADSDPRVTRVGNILRRTSIDELPNLWNVLKGDMSLVGPRPEILEMLPYYGRAVDSILSLKPGLTSLAKVRGRDKLTFSETLQYDLHYVLARSTWLDAKILFWTAMTLLRDGWVIN